MATNLALNNDLINEAVKLGNHKTKKEAVTKALEEYIARRQQQKIKELFGKIDYDPKYDYKKQRARN
ncbi:MAG TPA: type II toxin-antitoxin system VapB family antitoxin [Ignavibacteria bacterium]|nr:type II toxin-antitoxin system VapB family antitoxin [Ignavibacteria bacterium]